MKKATPISVPAVASPAVPANPNINMKLSDNGRHFIESWEGLYLHSYRDSVGVWTIGYGHTSAAGPPQVIPGMSITSTMADNIFASDMRSVELDVIHATARKMTQQQFDCFVSFDFNTGAYARSNVHRAFQLGADASVPPDLMMWVHGHIGGVLVVINGLVRRRRAEGLIFTKGIYQGA